MFSCIEKITAVEFESLMIDISDDVNPLLSREKTMCLDLNLHRESSALIGCLHNGIK